MVTDGVRILSLDAGRGHLATAATEPGAALVVPVQRAVPPWLAELVTEAAAAGAVVVVDAVPPAGLVDDDRAGWEIGVCLGALEAGAHEVTGIDPRRVARVRAVVAALAAGTRPDAAETAP